MILFVSNIVLFYSFILAIRQISKVEYEHSIVDKFHLDIIVCINNLIGNLIIIL